MSIQAWSQNLTDEGAQAYQVTRVSKEQLLSTSDFVSLHVVLSERTRGLIDRHALSLMKKSAFLINTSRGPLVREDALIDALSNGAVAGAALDVFDTEPLPAAHAYRALKNVIVTPHIGYITDDQYRLFYGQVVENILAFLVGSPIRLLRMP
jgi:phosphoglycerate dehydrogenase-like enzyme